MAAHGKEWYTVDKELHDLKVEQRARLDLHGDPYKVNVYTYYLGANGPFSFELPSDEAEPEKVEAKIAEQCAHLRAIGALPAAAGY